MDGWISTIDLGVLEAPGSQRTQDDTYEMDPHGSLWPLTNKRPKNLGRTYLPVWSSVLSMETVVGELGMRRT
jgi:hypothetical protein